MYRLEVTHVYGIFLLGSGMATHTVKLDHSKRYKRICCYSVV